MLLCGRTELPCGASLPMLQPRREIDDQTAFDLYILPARRGFCAGVGPCDQDRRNGHSRSGAHQSNGAPRKIVHNKFCRRWIAVETRRKSLSKSFPDMPRDANRDSFSAHGVPKARAAKAEARNMVYCRRQPAPPCSPRFISKQQRHADAGLQMIMIGPRRAPRNHSGRWGKLHGRVLLLKPPAECLTPSRCAIPAKLAICHPTRSSVDDKR